MHHQERTEKMINTTTHRRSALAGLTALLALTLAALACSPTGGPAVTSAPVNTKTAGETETSAVTESASTATEASTTEAASAGGEITTGNAADLVALRTIDASTGWISGLSFSPVDHTVATFGLGRSVDVWDADTGKLSKHLGTQADWGLGLAFSPDAAYLASGATGGDVVIWDMSKKTRLAGVVAPPSRVYDLEWSPDSKRFSVVGQESSHLLVFGATGTKIQDIKTSGGWLWSTAWSKDFLAASNDAAKKIFVFDATSYAGVTQVDTPAPAGELDFSPDGKYMVGCFRTDGSVHVWDTSNWTEVNSWTAHPSKGNAQGCIAGDFSKDGTVYFTGGDDGNLNVWDVKTGTQLNSFTYGKMVWKISVSGDGTLVAAGLDDGSVQIIGLK